MNPCVVFSHPDFIPSVDEKIKGSGILGLGFPKKLGLELCCGPTKGNCRMVSPGFQEGVALG